MTQSSIFWRSLAVNAVFMSLAACDASGPNSPAPNHLAAQTIDNSSLSILNDDASATDLTITQTSHSVSATGKVRLTIGLASTESKVAIDALSFTLEYSTKPDFSSIYKTALFEQQIVTESNGNVTLTARTRAPQLPDGAYYARVQINPDWHTYLENSTENADLSDPLHYISESNYTNNFSEVFTLTVNSGIRCSEDTLENNDNMTLATPLVSGASIRATLCEDNADFYKLQMQSAQTAVLSFRYTSEHNTTFSTRYSLINSLNQRIETGVIDVAEKDIQITAQQSGAHYFVVFGDRNAYQLSRDTKTAVEQDWFFSTDAVDGPLSPIYGQITLNRLQFSEAGLINHTVHCSRYVTSMEDSQSYVTPSHFPDIHKFHFLDNNSLVIDDEHSEYWNASTGDISSNSWYKNRYFGWAEKLDDGGFRYWNFDGASYIECHFK